MAPKKDDNFADMDLQVDNPYEYGYYSYQDGDSTTTKVNKSDEYIMVKFDNLTMVDSKGNTLTFHGSAPMPFRFH